MSDEPFARGEYESYVPGIVTLVKKTDGIQLIAEHHECIVREDMELSADRARCVNTAEILLRHKKTIKEGCA